MAPGKRASLGELVWEMVKPEGEQQVVRERQPDVGAGNLGFLQSGLGAPWKGRDQLAPLGPNRLIHFGPFSEHVWGFIHSHKTFQVTGRQLAVGHLPRPREGLWMAQSPVPMQEGQKRG